MINVPTGAWILLTSQPIDFRKRYPWTAALAQEVLAEDPFSGTVIVYRSKRADPIKIFVWDTSGLVLIWKQLQQAPAPTPLIEGGIPTEAMVAHVLVCRPSAAVSPGADPGAAGRMFTAIRVMPGDQVDHLVINRDGIT